MKKFYLINLLVFFLFLTGIDSLAQCGMGYTQAQLNWDNVDYYWNSGGNGPYENYITDAMEQSQRFGIGSNYLTIATSSNALVNPGSGNHADNTTHIGEMAGYTGSDVQYNPSANGQFITITFNNAVTNLNFALYDVDASARFDFAAVNGILPQLITLTGGANNTIFLNGTFAPYVTSTGTNAANNVNTNTVTVTVAGPVTQITITATTIGTDAVFWLSDINACVTGSFPNNYNQAPNSQPFTGPAGNQPDYFIVTPDNNSAYIVDPATGNTRWLFTDASMNYMNSFGYDPYNHLLYYISENVTVNPANKALKRYDLTTGTITTLVADITATLGIPTFNYGVESAGAAYYDGAIYVGIEGGKYDPSGTSNDRTRETIFWRINLDGSLNPTVAYQVYASNAFLDASTTSIHDFGDFVIKNGVLYDFNTARNSSNYSQSKYQHFNLMTGASTIYNNPGTTSWNGQAGMTWSGNLYYFRATGSGTSGVGYYDEAGNNSAPLNITLIGGGPAWPGGAGDASENFRPRCDFGDAPASYDPVATSPAVHERFDSLRLGLTWDNEWVKTSSVGAGADGTDEDGVSTVPLLDTGTFNYAIDVDVYNNSGANATVSAWLDYNGNGVYDASEGVTTTVATSASMQTVTLVWWGINTPLLIGQTTYLRVRITSASKGMGTANPTGYYDVGEVEDYQVLVDRVLPVDLISFDVKLHTDNTVKIDWKTDNENNVGTYQVERSSDGVNWNRIASLNAKNQNDVQHYSYTDNIPLKGKSYYRLRITNKPDGSTEKYSVTRTVTIQSKFGIQVLPNPAVDKASVLIDAPVADIATFRLVGISGKVLYQQTVNLKQGMNTVPITGLTRYQPGVYMAQIVSAEGIFTKQFIIKNN